MKERRVAFIDPYLKDMFLSLANSTGHEKDIYFLLEEAIQKLKENPECGIKIQKSRWPKYYSKRYVITNLWKYNLPQGWRLIYTIKINEIEIVAVILEWFSHKEYDRRFGY